MVTDNGKPLERSLDVSIAASRPQALEPYYEPEALTARQLLNLQCCTDPQVTAAEIKHYISTDKRLDMEQAAAMAVSLIPEHTSALLPLLHQMITSACMWREAKDFDTSSTSPEAARAARRTAIATMLQRLQWKEAEVADPASLTRALMQIRRRRPKLGNTQRLRLPEELLDSNSLLPASQRASWQESYRNRAQAIIPDADAKVVSKSIFHQLQCHLNRMLLDPSPTACLNRDIDQLDKLVNMGAGRLEALLTTDDRLALAFSFIALQRRRQQKVVSDTAWTSFLKKGEGSSVLQNMPSTITSFEKALWDLAVARVDSEVDRKALTAVCTVPGEASCFQKDICTQVDQVCLLMERYVLVHGQGSFELLRYVEGVSGGGGRGPVDKYNLLVDMLTSLKSRASQLGQPIDIGPCYKFLAKDIMTWNESFADDAFAPGQVPGWPNWLAQRRHQGTLVSD